MKPMVRPRKSHGRAQRHRKEKPLSPTMKRAVELARESGGYLDRYGEGFYWTGREGWTVGKRFSPRTIQALVGRGLAVYTDFRETDVGEFAREPIEVTLTAKAADARGIEMKRGTPRRPRIVYLSPAMRRAIELTRANGGRLMRHEGQSWAGDEVVPLPGRPAWFTTRTIQALVDRGLALYTDFRETDVGQFAREPTEVTLTANGHSTILIKERYAHDRSDL